MKYLKELMKQRRMSCSKLSRACDVNESTIRDILNDNVRLELCKVGTLYDIANVLETTIEDILSNYWREHGETSCSILDARNHRNTKNNTVAAFYQDVDKLLKCLKKHGDKVFLSVAHSSNCVQLCFEEGRHRSGLFVLGLMDYLCRKNGYAPHSAYNAYRRDKLMTPMYPLRLMNTDMSCWEYSVCKKMIMENAVPELACFNIYMTEDDLRLKS